MCTLINTLYISSHPLCTGQIATCTTNTLGRMNITLPLAWPSLECGTFSLPHDMMRLLLRWLQDIVEALMMCFGNQCPDAANKLNANLQAHFPNSLTLEFPDSWRTNHDLGAPSTVSCRSGDTRGRVPWRPHRAAPETKDFLTTKTRVANHTLFPSTASKNNAPTSIIPTLTLVVKRPRRLSLSSDTAAQSLILKTCAQHSNRHSPSPNKQTHW